ncbi:protein O-mannosyltransferase 1 [Ischnura elegans]|uniref:protein O-mannosyltransferase 1 n=1 Tax=Ischnura elegans TaxID=197161 RepID=UPI001ED87878|nr:protein O-mannosyltransferase 1 [Ischnura elegans]
MDSEVRNRKNIKESKINKKNRTIKYLDDVDSPKAEDILKKEGDENLSHSASEEKLQNGESDDFPQKRKRFSINVEVDFLSLVLFLSALITRLYRLEEPSSIVFDELHYGKYISLYMKRTFFFDSHPPLGKQVIALVAYLAGFDGQFNFDRIGSAYTNSVPVFALRLVPALCGSLMIPTAYHVILELGYSQGCAALAGFLFLFDNALLTQSRFILMESMLLFLALLGVLCLLKFRRLSCQPFTLKWWLWLFLMATSLTGALCVKYAGIFTCMLGLSLVVRDYWRLLGNKNITNGAALKHFLARSLVVLVLPMILYVGVFRTHLSILSRAGPHDSVMTSAFQASLEGGLASITKGQPLEVAHGSQVTLRHTHGRTCWLHSHAHVYPLRYPDDRGSSHQQQVTCYSFKDVNNWWIVKRPEKTDLVVSSAAVSVHDSMKVDAIRHGDVIQLIHGITGRALNTHDVAAPMSPQNQEVSCYIDYNVSMPAQNLWRVEIVNRDQVGPVWHTIESLVQFIHVNTSHALRFSGKQLPEWGFNQHEVVSDRNIQHDDAIWNVEEHRYTQSEDKKDREKELVNAEMIPLRPTRLSFWEKFSELQWKMLFTASGGAGGTDTVQNHMYSSSPLDWPFMATGIAYWVSSDSNAQVHLLGNVVIWYSGTVSVVVYSTLLVFYLLRQRRKCYDISEDAWKKFLMTGEVLLGGYLLHYVPYFFTEKTLFLHSYFPALVFKILLTAALIEHLHSIITESRRWRVFGLMIFWISAFSWLVFIIVVFRKFSVFCYGNTPLTANDILNLRWRESWDFIVHRQ